LQFGGCTGLDFERLDESAMNWEALLSVKKDEDEDEDEDDLEISILDSVAV
jgi:hypothetical protein